jgi:hypothetical protein
MSVDYSVVDKDVQEAIRKIEEIYHAGYELNNPNLSVFDQLLVCEAIDEAEREYGERYNNSNNNVSVSGDVLGSPKLKENSDQNLTKIQAIARLKQLNHKTPALEIEICLNIIFGQWKEKPEHWLFIAQHYTPKTINSIIAQMIKRHQRKDASIKTPGAYFSSVIKHRHKRIIFRRTNGIHKQNKL